MKEQFKDYLYQRPDVDSVTRELALGTQKIKDAADYQQYKQAIDETAKISDTLETAGTLVMIRHHIDTTDVFYEKEQQFWDEHDPIFEDAKAKLITAILDSPFCAQLKTEYPETFFLTAENKLKAFDEKIIGDLQEENRLINEYNKVTAQAKIEFQGKTLTLAALSAYVENPDESVRKAAFAAYWGFMESQEDNLDEIYDKLVKVRDRIAKTLGFDNFTQLGYVRMNRMGYGQAEVAQYRQEILKDVVPVCQKLYAAQKARIGKETLESFNEHYLFESGNPTPQHDKDTMVTIAQTMYQEMSDNLGEFFDFMVAHDLLDLEAKAGKSPGGFCTYIRNYRSPFIFSNFNGTSADVDVLTHEAGHAFQVYMSRDIKPGDSFMPTYDAAEIHSMSMEFLAWPYMERFFGPDTEKYFYYHLASAVQFLPYGVLVDHFQHEVYNNVDMTPAQRKATWRALEQQYLPHKNYQSVPFLEKGTWWFRQLHVFNYPFYYVDYTLAQVVALQFWLRLQNGDASALADYEKICKLGGTKSFSEIVKDANLSSPFAAGCLTDVMKKVDAFLEQSPMKTAK